ncbi:MAG: hypothetical protein RL148_2591 [Planctomycetota bacterium]
MQPLVESFVFGIANSLHCACMCGPLALAFHGTEGSAAGGALLYQSGRFVSYAAVGTGLGAAGSVLGAEQLGAPTAWVAFVLAAGLLLLALVGERGALQVPGLGSLVQRAMGWIRSKPAVLRAAWLGLLTPLLPCGLLWAACAGAAVAGSAWSGAQVMAGFALGSLPLLLLAQHQSLWLGRRFGPRTLALVQRGTMLVAAAILAWRGFAGLDGGCCH